jgi:hypothetical protein
LVFLLTAIAAVYHRHICAPKIKMQVQNDTINHAAPTLCIKALISEMTSCDQQVSEEWYP